MRGNNLEVKDGVLVMVKICFSENEICPREKDICDKYSFLEKNIVRFAD